MPTEDLATKVVPLSRAVASGSALRRACVLGWFATAASLVPAIAFAQPETAPPPNPTPPEAAPAPSEAAPAPSEPLPGTVPPTEVPLPEAANSERILNHHVFIFPAQVGSSLVTSYVGLRLRLGTQNVTNLPAATGPTDVNLVTFSEVFDVGIKFTDWLGIFVTAGVRSLIGTNLKALTYAGATYDVGFNAGPVVRLFRSERTGTQLSLSAGFGHTRGQVSTLYPIVEQPLQSAQDLLNGDLGEAIKTPFTTTTYNGTLAFTQGVSRLFGVQASFRAGGSNNEIQPYDRTTKTRSTTTVTGITYAVGAAPSFDFNAVHVPIAVMPEYVFSRQASSAQLRGAGVFDTVHLLGLGIYYSGRTDLQFGLVYSTRIGISGLTTPLGTSDSPTETETEFVLRYIW